MPQRSRLRRPGRCGYCQRVLDDPSRHVGSGFQARQSHRRTEPPHAEMELVSGRGGYGSHTPHTLPPGDPGLFVFSPVRLVCRSVFLPPDLLLRYSVQRVWPRLSP